MWVNKPIDVCGCITQEKYIKGKSLTEIERILGFSNGRLKSGIVVAALMKLPLVTQFELLGYTQVAEHRFNSKPQGLDVVKLKNMVLNNTFSLHGIDRLVKVIPNAGHRSGISNDVQYPPGQGVPQWKLIAQIPARIIAIVKPGEKYV